MSAPSSYQSLLEQLQQTYQQLNAQSLSIELLARVYHPEVEFIDPLHSHHGLAQVESYFRKLYANVSSIRFEFHQQLLQGDQGCLSWTMHYCHPKLAGGQEISVQGISLLEFDSGLIKRHRDYFDAGNMLYEHIPLLGRIIRWLKRRLS